MGLWPLPGQAGPARLAVRHLRRKPGKGLIAVFRVSPAGPRRGAGPRRPPVPLAAVKGWAWGSDRMVTLRLQEWALEGNRARFGIEEVAQAAPELESPGVVRARDLGALVQVFPADASLPALRACLDTSAGSRTLRVLERAGRLLLGDGPWRLVGGRAAPLRYKPGNRCVVLYELVMARPEHGPQAGWRRLLVCGKVFADRGLARSVNAALEALHRESAGWAGRRIAGRTLRSPLVPRPLGLVEDLGLLLSEMVEPEGAVRAPEAPDPDPADPWKPRIARGRGGVPVDLDLPARALSAAAVAMARLHGSRTTAFAAPPRTSSGEVSKLRERAALLAEAAPTQGETVLALADRVARRLECERPERPLPGHGSLKPTQLLLRRDEAVLVDLDALALADPSADVGCFLAYLRPTSLWRRRSSGICSWFHAAAAGFVGAYRRAMMDLGMPQPMIASVLERARAYEAAKLFRIAVRPVSRSNGMRPLELAAICGDVVECLDHPRRWAG
jgi:hypothetical protein